MLSSVSETKTRIAELWQRFDTHGNPSVLGFNDFYEMLKFKSVEEQVKPFDIATARFFYTGAALQPDKGMTVSEGVFLFKAFSSSEAFDISKLVFRGIDKYRTGTVGADEIADACIIFGDGTPVGEMLAKADKEIEGTNMRLNFARFIEVTTGQVIDKGFDPYDGKIPKSQCCNII